MSRHDLPLSRFSTASHPSLDDVLRWSRRRFLRVGAGSALALGAAACTSPITDVAPPTTGGGKADNLEFDEDGVCISGPTDVDALGPYWTPNIRDTIQLATPDELGQRLIVMGHVYARDCATPVPGASVVLWQADDEGLYDYNHAGKHQGSSQGVLTQAQTKLRGRLTTSVSGTYAFETIFPSEYPLNLLDPAHSAFRAPHIHYAVFYTDAVGSSHQLVTQMYFAPSALIRSKVPDIDQLNASDGGASTADSSRFIEIAGSERKIWNGQFDVVLDVDPDRVG